MAMYSIELRRYIDHFSQFENPPKSIKEKIEIGTPHLFDFEYPFFDENKRKDFERKWVRKFYMTEVGFETIELFKFHLENWMNEKMPYYNQRFKSELIEFDPLLNTKMDRDKTKSIDGTRNDDIKTTGNKNGSFHIDTKDDETSTNDSTENGKFDTQTANDNESSNEGTGHSASNGSIKGKTDKVIEDIGSKKGNNQNTTDGTNFARVLEEDTPDGRLDITTEDGKGIIRYASKINENTGKDHSQETQNIDESTKTNRSDNTIDDTTTNDETNTSATGKSESHDVGKASGTNESNVNQNGTKNKSGFQDGINKEDQTGSSKLEQSTNEHLNENESYVGKIGVETYSEMLMKYRETFLRIESEIYEECRRDLFMLVY